MVPLIARALAVFAAAAAVLATPAFVGPSSEAADYAVELAGVRAVYTEYGEGFEGLRPFNVQQTGVTVGVLVRAKRSDLVSVDTDASMLALYTDEPRTSLIGDSFQDGLGSFPEVSSDRAAALFEVHGSAKPDQRAKSVSVTGAVALRVASRSDTLRSAATALAKGSELSVGAWTFTLTSVDGAGDDLEIELETKRDPAAISAFRFRDADGAEVESDRSGSSSMRFGDSGTWSFSFRLAGPPERVALEVDAWADLKTIQVPVGVSFALPR